jgi:hypothetical protein
MKKGKDGKPVPNCVPESVMNEVSVAKLHKDLAKVVEAIEAELQKYKSNKGTPKAKQNVENLKKLNEESVALKAKIAETQFQIMEQMKAKSLKSTKVGDVKITISQRKNIVLWNLPEVEKYAQENGFISTKVDEKAIQKALDPDNLPEFAKLDITKYLIIK